METTREYSGSYSELLLNWIRGVEMSRLLREFASLSSGPEELGRFIDELFRYLLPWGVSSYTRIAAKMLDVGRSDLSEYVRFLPSMIKFGLPNPVACWAMSVGIPLRRIAISIAGAFLNESETLSYESFLEWLSALDSDRLRYDFSLRPPMLDDVSRAIRIFGVNTSLRNYAGLDTFLPREVIVRGIAYENRLAVASLAQEGQPVTLERDYDDLVDQNAILVKYLGADLGT